MLQTNLNAALGSSATALFNDNLKPQAYITVNKNRIKRYSIKAKSFSETECNVYLSGNTEFQIELFNPTQDTYLAKISMNGKPISNSGIVLYPGQRIFLDRFIEQNNKFIFKTYEVSGTNEEVKKAIEKNGIVGIEFYKEVNYCDFKGFLRDASYEGQTFYSDNNMCPKTYTNNQVFGMINDTIQTSAYNSITPLASSQIETGRVERGSASNQIFEKVNKDFSCYSSNKEIIKILPESQKVYTNKDLLNHRKYCSNCGKKVNPKDKFCSNCGKKL